MLDCWRRLPDERPTFTQLRERLRQLLEEVTYDYSYMNLNQARDYYNIIPTEYPTITSVQTQLPPVGNSTTVVMENETTNEAFQPNEALSAQVSSESDSHNSVGRSDSVGTPSAVITGASHRDSAGSDQLLITPTTPKFKFFKFKPNSNSKNALEVLPEGSTGSDVGDGFSTDGKSYSNAVYLEDLLPNSSIDYEKSDQSST